MVIVDMTENYAVHPVSTQRDSMAVLPAARVLHQAASFVPRTPRGVTRAMHCIGVLACSH
jgi:hypothetical protein